MRKNKKINLIYVTLFIYYTLYRDIIIIITITQGEKNDH